MGNYKVVGLVIGALLISLAVLMLIPAFGDLVAETGDWAGFVLSSVITGFCGGALILANQTVDREVGHREAFMLTVLSWVAISGFSALPFIFSNVDISFTDCVFEATSGITTTGATVLTNLDRLPHGLLLWRSLLQWIGGVGIIVTAVAVLPFLRIGGMQLFRTESSDRSEKVLPRPGQIALAVAEVYLLLTLLCALAYAITGLSPFDALNHAMTTVSTAGFSTHDASFGAFTDPSTHWVAILFMALGAFPLVVYIQMLRGSPEALWQDSQVQWLVLFVLGVAAVLWVWLWATGEYGGGDAARYALFNVISIATTTGYASTDYQLWGAFPMMVFFLLMFAGGCTGSTAGGVKIFRYQILWLLVSSQVRRTLYPHLAQSMRYGERIVDQQIVFSVSLFVFLYMASVGVLAMLLAALGLDLMSALTGAASAIGNVGPGLGEVIGPAGNFGSLPDSAKWAIAVGMLAGRLELLTLIVILSRDFWMR